MSKLLHPSRRRFIRTTAAATAAVTFGAPYIVKGATKKLRIATLAPKGSSWAKAFEKSAREVRERTGGEIEMKIYDGGVMGDEGAMVRKMRHGQLDGAAVTSVGLGKINQQLLMLQLPMLFKSYEQLDYVRAQMSATFAGMLEAEGFKFAAWGDVGWIYLFSNTPVKTPDDIKSTKMWVWEDDPVSKAVMSVAGVSAVPLGVPDVLTSLEAGLIDAFTNSPYGSIALQWYAKAKYVTNLKLSIGIGGSVLTQKAWDAISPEAQKVMTEITEENYGKLLQRIRSDNKKAMHTLKEKGLEVVEPENIAAWTSVATKVREKLVADKTFDATLVSTMLEHVKQAP